MKILSKFLSHLTLLTSYVHIIQGTPAEILSFVEDKFQAKDKFTWFEKGHVNGKDTR